MYEIRTIMSTDVISVRRDAPLQDVIELLVNHDVTGLPVVNDDGTLGKSRVFFDARTLPKPARPGSNDGMKVDAQGNLFATGPGGISVFAPDGTLLGRINTGVPTSNCRFGDDGSTLYITANTWLCRIRTATKGVEF